MSMTYCRRCDAHFDADAQEQAVLCGFCIRQQPEERVSTTIPLCIGDWPVIEFDCDFLLGWDYEIERWELKATYAKTFSGKDVRIERDGTVIVDKGWRLHATLAKAIANQALCELEAHRGVLTADLPNHAEPELIPYTDEAYRRIALAH